MLRNLFRWLIDTIIRKDFLLGKEEVLGNSLRRKGIIRLRKDVNSYIKSIIYISLGVTAAGFGLKGFVLPNGFIDGGAVGISLLIDKFSPLGLSTILVIVNIPFIILGYKTISLDFVIKAIIAITLLAITVNYLPTYNITEDKLLSAIFGGILLGAGIGFSIRGGAVIDGTEIMAIGLHKRFGISVGDVILMINLLIFTIGAVVISIEIALYSMLTYMSASKSVNFLLEGIEEYIQVAIVSDRNEEIREMITFKLKKGVTVYYGEGGYISKIDDLQHKKNKMILHTVVNRFETVRLYKEIGKIDTKAFITSVSLKESRGGLIKRNKFIH